MTFPGVLTPVKVVGQIIFFALLMWLVGYLSIFPKISVHDEQETELRLVVRHSGRVIGECTAVSEKELQNLPANMQRLVNCPREKSPMLVELVVDHELSFESLVTPSGLHNDGVLAEFKVFTLKTGTRHIHATATSNTHEGEIVEYYEGEVEFSADRVVVLQLDDSGFWIKGDRSGRS